MSSLVLSGDTSGTITVAAPAVAGTNTATLPAATGTIMVSGNMPAFSAYATASQNLTNNTATKIILPLEDFDTNNNFDSTTNYRFTPTIAGYYQFNASVNINGAVGNNYIASLYKNGAEAKRGAQMNACATGNTQVSVSSILYMNGTTDYVEFYAIQNSGTTQGTFGGSAYTWFNGSMVRAA